MEEVCEKACVFEESLEIDFDYEFDVAKFYDFLRSETVEDIVEAERWFYVAQGHPPSPILLKDEDQDALPGTSSGRVSKVSSLGHQLKKGSELLKSKSANQTPLSKNSRLLQPTASQLAKQNQNIGVRGKRTPPVRVQKLGSLLKYAGDVDATKRQKLEYGSLRKAGQLKHLTCFSHKQLRQVVSSNVNSCHARPKSAAPKKPCLETPNRPQRHRSKDAAELNQDSKHDTCSVRAKPANNRKALEPKKSTPLLSQVIKGAKKTISCSMKENKNPNTVVRKLTKCCLKQSHIGGGRPTIMAC